MFKNERPDVEGALALGNHQVVFGRSDGALDGLKIVKTAEWGLKLEALLKELLSPPSGMDLNAFNAWNTNWRNRVESALNIDREAMGYQGDEEEEND